MIEYKHIHVKYGKKSVFDNFSLMIKKGEKILLSAASGTGKTTLLRLLLGFSKPQKGEIIFDGKVLSKKTISDIRNRIAYVSQDVDIHHENIHSLLEDIFNYRYNRNKEFNQERLQTLMEYFDMPSDLLDKSTEDLSGGERQRLGIIIADLLERDVWALDEVTSGLDEALKVKVVKHVLEADKTVIVISHDSIWQQNNQFRKVSW